MMRIFSCALCALAFLCLLAGGASLALALRARSQERALCGEFGTDGYKDLLGKLSVITEVREKRDAMARDTEEARLHEVMCCERYEAAREHLTDLILRWSTEVPEANLDEFLDEIGRAHV